MPPFSHRHTSLLPASNTSPSKSTHTGEALYRSCLSPPQPSSALCLQPQAFPNHPVIITIYPVFAPTYPVRADHLKFGKMKVSFHKFYFQEHTAPTFSVFYHPISFVISTLSSMHPPLGCTVHSNCAAYTYSTSSFPFFYVQRHPFCRTWLMSTRLLLSTVTACGFWLVFKQLSLLLLLTWTYSMTSICSRILPTPWTSPLSRSLVSNPIPRPSPWRRI